MNDRQFDALLGISRNMEKSLSSIEKSLDTTGKTGGKATGVLASLSSSLTSLVSSISTKAFDSKKANNILDFSKGLVSVVNSVDAKKAKEFSTFADSFSQSIETIIEVMSPTKILKLALGVKVLFEGKSPLFKRIVEGASSAFKDLDSKKLKEGSEAVKILGEGLLSLTKAMKSLIVIGIAAPIVLIGALVAKGVISLFSSLGKKAKDIKEGGEALKELGKGLVLFSAGLATLILVTMIASPKLVVGGIAMLALFGLTFYMLGKVGKEIREGARALAFIGLALFGFSAGLATYMLAMIIIPPALILQGILTIAAFSLVFALLGNDKVAREVAQGALLLIGMAVALFFFSGGLMIFGMALTMFDPEDLLMGATLITGLGLAMYVLGQFEKPIERGAFVMAEMGIGLGLFSLGLVVFGAALKLFSASDILLGAGLIAGLGIAFSVVGGMASAVTPGAFAVAEMGGALVVFSVGLILYGLALKGIIALFSGDPLTASLVAASLIVGLGVAFSLVPPVAAAGAGAMIVVGIALMSISAGILLFGLALKALMGLFKDNLAEAGVIAGGIILGLGLAFSALGLMSPAIILGSVSGILIGATLIILSAGLLTFGLALKFLDGSKLIEKDSDGDYTLKGLSILSGLAVEFSKVGFIAGLNPFFYLGVATSIAMGAALTTIGVGLNAAAEALKNTPDMSKLIAGVFGDGGLIPSMAESFAKIGAKYGGFSAFFGVDDVSMGVQVTRQFGDTLQELAGGIVAFANFSEFPVKVPDPKDPHKLIYQTVDIFGEIIPKLNENLPLLLSTLATTFAGIGIKYGGDGGWFGDDSPVQKGIDAVKGLGSVLSELAGGMVAFANFEEFPVQIPDPKDPSKLIYKAVNLFDVVPKIKEVLVGGSMAIQGKLTPKSGILFALAEVFAEIGTKFEGDGFFSDNKVKAGVDAVQGIGNVVVDLAEGIVAFANMDRGLPNYDEKGKFNGTFTPFKLENVAINIMKVLTALPAVFAGVDLAAMESAKEKADAAVPLASAISKIGKSLQSLMVDKGEGEKMNLVEIIGPTLSKFVNDVKGIEIDDQKTKQLNDLANVLVKLSRTGDGLKTFAESLAATGDAFKKFTAGFSTFSTQLDKFARFETSFSNLVKNQYAYRFDKFSESMGILKTNVNAFDVEKLKLTDSLMKSLAVLSKQPDDIGDAIKESIKESFDQLTKLLEKMIKELKLTGGGEASASPFTAAPAPVVKATTAPATPVTQPKAPPTQMDFSAVINALTTLNNSLKTVTEGDRLKVKTLPG